MNARLSGQYVTNARLCWQPAVLARRWAYEGPLLQLSYVPIEQEAPQQHAPGPADR